MTTEQEINWLPDAEDHDYPAAASYLGLVYDDAKVRDLLAGLKAAGIARFKAKDIFRASRLSLLCVSNSHVGKDR